MPKLKKRSDGRYQCSAVIEGKRKYFYGRTQKEALQKMNEAIALSSRGVDLISAESSFEQWGKSFLCSIRPSLTAQQYHIYETRLNYFIKIFGNIEIRLIRPHHIQQAVNDLAARNPATKKPTAKKTLIEYRSIVKRAFDYAVVNRAIEYNPCIMISLPKDAPKKERTIIADEQKQWIEDTPHRMQTAAMIMLYAGLRRGEAAALLWSDIDLKNKTISVNKSYDFYEKQEKGTKTEAGFRIIPIPDNLVSFLIEKKSQDNSLYVLHLLDGQPITASALERLWRSYMTALNEKYGDFSNYYSMKKKQKKPLVIKTFTMHELRHTYCSTLYSAGVDLLTAKYLMGHKDVQTTLNVYTHLEKQKQEVSIDKLNQYYNKKIMSK